VSAKPKLKRLYRVTAEFTNTYNDYADDGDEISIFAAGVRTWHYQDKRAAQHRAEISRTGLPAIEGDHRGPGRNALPAANWVRIEESDPVTWPEASA